MALRVARRQSNTLGFVLELPRDASFRPMGRHALHLRDGDRIRRPMRSRIIRRDLPGPDILRRPDGVNHHHEPSGRDDEQRSRCA